MPSTAVSDFEALRQMQATLHKEETELAEARLIAEGSWTTRLESYEAIDPSRLPNASVVGYRLTFNVDESGTVKKHWVSVYFTPVSNDKGLILPSKLGVQLATVIGMNEGDSFTDMLERAKYTPVVQRIGKDKPKSGYKPKNTTWQIMACKSEV